jgi:SAM-dependent methyltransferase
VVDPMHFDKRAEVYERARPPYPDALWERLRELGVLRAGMHVVDIGAGAGLATAPLVAAGAHVTAVEPGRALAERLHARLPDVEILVATAEDADLAEGAFDLAVAATSVHWLDLGVVLPKLHRALVRGGHLAVWRNAYGDPLVSTPFRDRVEAITAQRDPASRTGPGELDTDDWVQQLTETGHFVATHTAHFRWRIELDAGQIHDLFSTFSNWSQAEVEAAAQAVRDLGGLVTEHYVTPLVVLERVDVVR